MLCVTKSIQALRLYDVHFTHVYRVLNIYIVLTRACDKSQLVGFAVKCQIDRWLKDSKKTFSPRCFSKLS